MEKRGRPKSIAEWKNCYGIEKYIWHYGALCSLRELRAEFYRRLAGLQEREKSLGADGLEKQIGNSA